MKEKPTQNCEKTPTQTKMIDSSFLSCHICNKPIYEKLEDFTFEEGKPVHAFCLKKKRGRNKS